MWSVTSTICRPTSLLQAEGHYLSGMLYYGGEWYWGLDRLVHLERRLNGVSLAPGNTQLAFDRGYRDFVAWAARGSCRMSGVSRPS